MEVVSYVFMIIGASFIALAGLGLFRMPDTLNRIQAGTKATTLGVMCILVGVGLFNFAYLPKALIVIIFIAVSNPIGSSVLAKATYKSDQFDLVTDELADYYKGGK
jgi:multicomponent Na+:H+ antiporter subunit G